MPRKKSMLLYGANGKRIALMSQPDVEAQVGFEICDYVTLVLAVKRLYDNCDAALVSFGDEWFACEGRTITPLSYAPDLALLESWTDGAFGEFCLKILNALSEGNGVK